MDEGRSPKGRILCSDEIFSTFVDLLKSASDRVVLISPYIHFRLFEELLDKINDSVHVILITTWRAEDIVAGFNDLRIKDVMDQRGNSELRLLWNLHAKYYRVDNDVLLGSGNLTHRGLNAGVVGNSEVMIQIDHNFAGVQNFESGIFEQSSPADDELYKEVFQLVEQLRALEKHVGQLADDAMPAGHHDGHEWLPTCEMPNVLFNVYVGDTNEFDSEVVASAKADLEYFGLPNKLAKKAFNAHIRGALGQSVMFTAVLEVIRRDNRITDELGLLLVSELFPLVRPLEVEQAWASTKRWLAFFYPQRFQIASV